jgi:hypothetical protein
MVAACVVWMAAGCGSDEGKDATAEGNGEGGSEAGGTEAGGTEAGGSEAGSSEAGGSEATQASASADESGNESSAEDCESASSNGPCSTPGYICTYGDDCGSSTFECQNDQWVQIDADGCNAEPIPCSASPVEGDGCGEMWYEECDLDGDCQDVLQCDTFEWVLREACCAELAPALGEACDEPWRECVIEEECGERRYLCQDGAWSLASDCD